MVYPALCRTHEEENLYNCSWCSARICESCVAEASGKKYCAPCANKFKVKSKPLVRDVTSIDE